jgi:hypothetical protein
MDIERADTMSNGWERWLEWMRAVAPDNELEIRTLEADRGSCLGYVRLVGRRRARATLPDHIVSVPEQYTRRPLLRGEERRPLQESHRASHMSGEPRLQQGALSSCAR